MIDWKTDRQRDAEEAREARRELLRAAAEAMMALPRVMKSPRPVARRKPIAVAVERASTILAVKYAWGVVEGDLE